MKKVLIVYGTKEGQTQKIAQFMTRELITDGILVEIYNAEIVPTNLDMNSYDAFLIGGSLHYSKFSEELEAWIVAHHDELNQKPSGFFVVCLGILQKDDYKVQEDIQNIIQTFLDRLGWIPTMSSVFAGAVMYSQYNLITRWVMRHISKKAGTDTDTSYDHEYTDWDQVRAFTKRFEALMDAPIPPKPRDPYRDIGKEVQNLGFR